MSCGVGHRCASDPVLLWLWCRPAAEASDLTPSLGISYATHAALKKKKKKKKKKGRKEEKNVGRKKKAHTVIPCYLQGIGSSIPSKDIKVD